MFSIFKSKVKEEEITVKETVKTNNEWVEEIHETFYSEVDRLLASANIKHRIETDKEALITKKQKLEALGFSNTKEVQEASSEVSRINNLKNENHEKEVLVEAINYFSFKYPFYKFITEDSVKKICEKYNLIYSTVNNYIGEVPDENLEQMENFKIEDLDKSYIKTTFFGIGERALTEGVSYEDYLTYQENRNGIGGRVHYLYTDCKESKLEICAPIKDFNVKNMEVRDFKLSKIEILDPVVLQPVNFKGTKHYLIVTAWGLEASDELVVNSINN